MATRGRPAPVDERLALASENLDRLLEWISRVDNKAGYTFVVVSAMLGAMAGVAPPGSRFDTWLWVSTTASAALLVGAAAVLMLVAFPRTRTPPGVARLSLFYFGTIASLPAEEYGKRFVSASDSELLDDLLSQSHVNSGILNAKFNLLRLTHRILFVAILPWTFTLLRFAQLR